MLNQPVGSRARITRSTLDFDRAIRNNRAIENDKMCNRYLGAVYKWIRRGDWKILKVRNIVESSRWLDAIYIYVYKFIFIFIFIRFHSKRQEVRKWAPLIIYMVHKMSAGLIWSLVIAQVMLSWEQLPPRKPVLLCIYWKCWIVWFRRFQHGNANNR